MVLDLSLPPLQAILARRTAALEEPLDLYAAAARELRGTAPARADFIEAQCRGEDAEDLFEIYREAWDIPKFDDALVTVADFRRGFLWTFRDHDPSWAQQALARHWFFTAPEAMFARRLELWTAKAADAKTAGADEVGGESDGEEECSDEREGSYRELVRIIFGGGEGDLGALVSPAFTSGEFATLRGRLLESDPHLRQPLAAISIQRGS